MGIHSFPRHSMSDTLISHKPCQQKHVGLVVAGLNRPILKHSTYILCTDRRLMDEFWLPTVANLHVSCDPSVNCLRRESHGALRDIVRNPFIGKE